MGSFDKLKSWLGIGRPPESTEPAESDQSPTAEASPASAQRVKRRRGVSATTRADARLESEARALFDHGDSEAAMALLRRQGVLVARHEATALPCLCGDCLLTSKDRADSAGASYHREFVVASHRVLFYWLPAELAEDAKRVRASMRSELRRRLRTWRSEELEVPRIVPDPFNPGRSMTIKPKRRRWIDPFTGKPVR